MMADELDVREGSFLTLLGKGQRVVSPVKSEFYFGMIVWGKCSLWEHVNQWLIRLGNIGSQLVSFLEYGFQLNVFLSGL